MTAWETMKAKATENKQSRIVYLMAVLQTVDMFVVILPFLKNRSREEDAYIHDKDATEAMAERRFLTELKHF